MSLPIESRSRIDNVLKLKVRARDGVLVSLSELVQIVQTQRDYPIYHKDLMPVVYVVGDMAGKLDSPLYGMFGIDSKLDGKVLQKAARCKTGTSTCRQILCFYALKWDGEWQVTFETSAIWALPMQWADTDLPAGGGAVQELSGAARHHGADSADHHRVMPDMPCWVRSSPPPR